MVHFEKLLDPIKFLFFWKKKNRKKWYFRLKYELFSRKLGGPFFLSQSLPTLGILHTKFGWIWTTSWPDKKDLFLKLFIWKNRKLPYEKLFFSLGKLYKNLFLLYTFITLVIIHTKCGSIWTTPWPDKSSIFLKIEKLKKSIFPIEIQTFFSLKVRWTIFFASVSTYPEDTQYQVWFDLKNFLTR